MNESIRIAQAESETEIDAVRDLLREYVAWAFTLATNADQSPTFQRIDEELATLPGVYALPAGRLLLATYGGQPAGCVCLKPHDGGLCEVKRLYVRPKMRGLDLGRRLIAKLVEDARSAGYRRIALDSHVSMTHAHAIYESAGFKRITAPDDVPEWVKDVAIFMELELGDC
jgi:GNAT superfamily N-acetyltransferase